MAVTSFGRDRGYPKSDFVLNGKRITETHTDRFKIQVDSESENGKTILAQLPYQIGVYLAGTDARINSIKFERDPDARLLWYMNLGFTTEFDDEADEDKDKPPDQRRPEWSWDFETLPRAMTVDVDGEHIASSAGDPIEHEGLIVIPVLTIERFQQTFDPDTIITYFNHTNESAFWGAPQGTALMAGIRDRKDSQEVYQGVAYRRVTYVVKFALPKIDDVLEGWKLLLVDHGWHKLDGGTKKPILEGGARVSRNLDGSGGVLATGADPHILKFNVTQEADFDALGINWGQF